MTETVLRLEGVGKTYRLGKTSGAATIQGRWKAWRKGEGGGAPTSFQALQDINLDIHKGERVALLGRNGAGKSTLLKLLARITAPTEGTIYINGRVRTQRLAISLCQVSENSPPNRTYTSRCIRLSSCQSNFPACNLS